MLLRLWIVGLFLAAPAVAQTTAAPSSAAAETESALADLLATLKDDAARAALIAELEAATSGAAQPADTVPEILDTPLSLGERIAVLTKALAEDAVGAVTSLYSSLRGGTRLLRGLNGDTWNTIFEAAVDLALVIAVTIGVFVIVRRLTIPMLRRMGRRTIDAGLVVGGFAVLGSIVIRVIVVALAWAIAYGLTIVLVGNVGEIGLRQSLFLNAFLLVELVKVGVRTVFSPAADDLRGLPMTDRAARRVSRIASVAISILGYGVLLVVPIVSDTSGLLATRAVSVLVVELTLLYLAIAVIWHHRAVSEWLVAHVLAPADPDAEPRQEGFIHALLTHWHWLALGYLALLGVQMLTRSLEAMGENVLAVIKIAAVAFAGALILRYLGQRTRAGIDLPKSIEVKLPLLEARLNGVIPRVLTVLRGVTLLAVVVYALDTMGLTTIGPWLAGERGGPVLSAAISVALIAFVAWGLWLALASWVDYRLNPDYGDVPSSRETTLLTLLRNAVTVALIILTVMFVLSEIGLNIGPLIASAGVLGLAIGFGAQKLVQDIITGVFIQFENAINVGDVVTVGGITGAVEKLTIRSVSLRDLHGIFHIVPFSSVDMVSNYTREFSFYVIDMGVAYREEVDEVKDAMFAAYDELREDPEQGAFLLGDLEYFGLDSFGDSAVVVRARIKTWPGKQWGVGRAYNRVLKHILDARGIEIPFPHRTLVFAEAKDGSLQKLPVETAPKQDG